MDCALDFVISDIKTRSQRADKAYFYSFLVNTRVGACFWFPLDWYNNKRSQSLLNIRMVDKCIAAMATEIVAFSRELHRRPFLSVVAYDRFLSAVMFSSNTHFNNFQLPLLLIATYICWWRVTAIFEKGIKALKRIREQRYYSSVPELQTFDKFVDIPEAAMCIFCFLVKNQLRAPGREACIDCTLNLFPQFSLTCVVVDKRVWKMFVKSSTSARSALFSLAWTFCGSRLVT